MASPLVISLVSLLLVFFAANALLFMIARFREARRDEREKKAEENILDEGIEGMMGSDL